MRVVYAIGRNLPYSQCYYVLKPPILLFFTSPPAPSSGTNTSHPLPPWFSHFVSKFLSPLSAFDPLISPLSLHTHWAAHIKAPAHSDGVLTHATLSQKGCCRWIICQGRACRECANVCVCVFVKHKSVVFACGCEDITGLLLYSGESLPPSSYSFPCSLLTSPTGRWDWTRQAPLSFSIWCSFFRSELMPSCPPCRN